MGGDRRAAFVEAWAIVKAGGLEVAIKGVSFGNRQEALRRLAAYSPELIRAVRVLALLKACNSLFYRRNYKPFLFEVRILRRKKLRKEPVSRQQRKCGSAFSRCKIASYRKGRMAGHLARARDRSGNTAGPPEAFRYGTPLVGRGIGADSPVPAVGGDTPET
jgi:hypothetical protein